MATNAELAARTRYRMKKQDAQDAAARAMLAALNCALDYLGDDGTDDSPEARHLRTHLRETIAQAEAAGIASPDKGA